VTRPAEPTFWLAVTAPRAAATASRSHHARQAVEHHSLQDSSFAPSRGEIDARQPCVSAIKTEKCRRRLTGAVWYCSAVFKGALNVAWRHACWAFTSPTSRSVWVASWRMWEGLGHALGGHVRSEADPCIAQ